PQHHPGKDLVEPVDLVGGVGTVALLGPLHADPIPGPRFHLGVPGPHEQNELSLRMVGSDDTYGIGLLDAGQVDEVGGLAEPVVVVAVSDHLRCGGDDGAAVGPDALGAPATVVGESVSHAAYANQPPPGPLRGGSGPTRAADRAVGPPPRDQVCAADGRWAP